MLDAATQPRILITPVYAALNRQLHKDRPDYGAHGKKWAGHIFDTAQQLRCESILDYGCGKGGLKTKLLEMSVRGGLPTKVAEHIYEYDPAIPGKDGAATAADLVACTDVLEHVEPECLDAVLDDLKRLTLRAIFINVATRPAEKVLADGRNAHLIIEPYTWWMPKLWARWEIMMMHNAGGEFVAVCVVEMPKMVGPGEKAPPKKGNGSAP